MQEERASLIARSIFALLTAGAFLLGSPAVNATSRKPTPPELLDRYRPVLIYDADERYRAQPVTRPFDSPRAQQRNRVYGRVAHEGSTRWLQYWLFYAYNPQDRGIFRTGRHEGDWELVQFRLGEDSLPETAALSQHSAAEACAFDELAQVMRNGGTGPAVYVASGSHANYSRPGVHDRPFPDPNDEADGRGETVKPQVVPIAATDPAWVSYPGRWGRSDAGWVPGETSSPRGPRYAANGAWNDPAGFEASGRPCGSAPPGRWWQTPALILLVLLLIAGFVAFQRRWSRSS